MLKHGKIVGPPKIRKLFHLEPGDVVFIKRHAKKIKSVNQGLCGEH